MRAVHFLCFNNSRIYGEDLVPVQGGGSVIVVAPLLIVTPIVGFCNCSVICCALLCVHSSFATISLGKIELVALVCLSYWCIVIVVWLFHTMPWICLQLVIVVFPDHTHMLFLLLIALLFLSVCLLVYVLMCTRGVMVGI